MDNKEKESSDNSKAPMFSTWKDSDDDSSFKGTGPNKKRKFWQPEFLSDEEVKNDNNDDKEGPEPVPVFLYHRDIFCSYCSAFECPLCKMEKIIHLHDYQQEKMDLKFKVIALKHDYLWDNPNYDMETLVCKLDPEWEQLRDNQAQMERDCEKFLEDAMDRIKNIKWNMRRWKDCGNQK